MFILKEDLPLIAPPTWMGKKGVRTSTYLIETFSVVLNQMVLNWSLIGLDRFKFNLTNGHSGLFHDHFKRMINYW